MSAQLKRIADSYSAIDLPEAEDVFDNFCDRGFSESREIRTAFFRSGETLRGERWHYFQNPGRHQPPYLKGIIGEKLGCAIPCVGQGGAAVVDSRGTA